ncbi:MAG: hypothetical protein R3F08_01440 [Dokdonella sp.]|nr:hypothetical protein [Dokdonella sp.]MCB1573063.1 hypothetical protein [Xanthomonadales bacterium]
MKKLSLAAASAAFCLAQAAIAAPVNNKIAAPTPGATPGGASVCTSTVVLDCGFESGTPSANWTEASTNFGTPLCDTAGCGTGGAPIGPNSGSFWAWFGGIAAFEEGSVSQSITIPAAATGTLTFYFLAPVCSGDAPDFIEATIDGNQVWSVDATNATYCDIDTAYTQISVDVSSYADGGSHTLAFHSIVNGVSGTTNFWIDDVDLVTAGTPGGPPPAARELPSLGTIAMIGMGGLLALLGFGALRRRRAN